MFRRSRRRRHSGRRFIKTIGVGLCVLIVLFVAMNGLDLEPAVGQQAMPYLLGGLIVVWLVTRRRRSRPAQLVVRPASPRRRASRGIDQLYALGPYEFEAYVRDLLSAIGYRDLRLNGGSGDLGVDIWGRTPHGQTAAIQCKRYVPGKNVGSPMIQTFIGMQKIHHGADVGLFVTTSGFTLAARKLAYAHGIQLIDGPDLLRLQKQAGRRQRRGFGFLRR